MNIPKKIKRALGLSQLKVGVSAAHRNVVFQRALRDYAFSPWSALNVGSDILSRLVKGWGNASWSADSEYLQAIIIEFSRTSGPVLECGSGLSTIVLGVLGDATGRKIWVLENDPTWAEKVRVVLKERGINSVDICVQPLKNYGEFSWYDPPLEQMPKNFSLVICDGPPGDGHGGRTGLLPVMGEYFDKNIVLLIDDVRRPEEKAVAENWARNLSASIEDLASGLSFAAIRFGCNSGLPRLARSRNLPGVTVGIPTFNNAATIGRSVDSILCQSYPNVTLLVSDNHSSDGTQESCVDRVASTCNLQYMRQLRNAGVHENYNELARKCTTKYFKWQSSSDWSDPTLLQACVDVLEARPDVVLVCPSVWLENEGDALESYDGDFGLEMDDPVERLKYLFENIKLCNIFNGVVRTDALRRTRLNQSFYGSDVMLLAELALMGKFVLLPDRLWRRKMTPEGASKLKSPAEVKEFFVGAKSNVSRHVIWKMNFALLKASIRHNKSLKNRIRCLGYVAKKSVRGRRALIKDLFS